MSLLAGPETLLDEAIDALMRERELLMNGDLSVLLEEDADREARIDKLEALPQPLPAGARSRVERLQREAAANAELLRAAINGAGAGRRRVEEILAARDTLSSYDSEGRKVDRLARNKLEKRA